MGKKGFIKLGAGLLALGLLGIALPVAAFADDTLGASDSQTSYSADGDFQAYSGYSSDWAAYNA